MNPMITNHRLSDNLKVWLPGQNQTSGPNVYHVPPVTVGNFSHSISSIINLVIVVHQILLLSTISFAFSPSP